MLGATSNKVVAVQDEQPTDTDTKIWLPETEATGIQVPTMEDMNTALAGKVSNVQINGTSIVQNGIANIPIAAASTLGTVKVNNQSIGITSDGAIGIVPASSNIIKVGTSFNDGSIVPARQHESVFYGLAKAAGDTTQSASSNAVGTYTAEAKAAIQTMLDIPKDIRINNASISNTDGVINLSIAISTDIKNGSTTYKPLTPNYQHHATFYGLAKAAGVDMASSSNAIGTYTAEAKTAIQSMLGIPGDVQVNGTSIVSNGVANIPLGDGIAYVNGALTLKTDTWTPIQYNVGAIRLKSPTEAAIKDPDNNYGPNRLAIQPYIQHQSVFYGLAKAAGDTTQSASSNAVGTYTSEAKAAIHTMLGIDPASIAAQVDIPLVETVSGTTPTITGQPNVRYVCGEVSTITITPPASGSVDVIFESGSTATTITVPSTVKWPAWFDAEALEANTTYEVLITDGIYGSVMTWAT